MRIEFLRKTLDRCGPLRIVVTLEYASTHPHDRYVARLQEYARSFFTIPEAAKALGISYRTLHRAVQDAVARGIIVRYGKNSGARYRFLASV